MLRTERMVRFVACRRCSSLKRERCSNCDGQGFQMRSMRRMRYDGRPEYVAERVPCGPCYGIGYVPCTGCGGKGQVIR
jgi:DnaJ-class molecular chaperone